MPTGLLSSAQNLLNQPYGGYSPIGPAGITDLQRQGQLTSLGGIASQANPAQQYAQNAGQMSNWFTQNFNQGMNSGGFGWNPQMQQSVDLSQQAAGGNPFTNAANRQNWSALDPSMYGASNSMYGQSTNQPMLNQAGGQVGSTLNNFGGGYSTDMADTINTTGASFNPMNPYLQGHIAQANQQLGRDFNQQVMPQMDSAATASGVGGYGGARAGVAQGIREQGLADAMQRQTTDMMNQGYESGLNRYVQDRGQTVSATLDAMRTGGSLGMQGAQTLGNLGQMQGALQQNAASGYGTNAANMASNRLNAAQTSAGLSGQQQNAQLGAASQIGGLGQYGLGQQNNMYQAGMTGLPNLQSHAYNAGMAPGNVQQNLGNAMQGYGQQQQAQNQNVSNWYNSQFNAAQQYPQQQFGQYANTVNPYLQAGGQQPGAPVQGNPFTAGIGGAMAGYGAYNSWQNSQSSPNPYQGQPGFNPNMPGQYGPLAQNGTMIPSLNYAPAAPQVGGFGY